MTGRDGQRTLPTSSDALPDLTPDEFPKELGMRVVSRRYHLHVPGLVYIATTVMLAFGAVHSQNNLIFWAFGIAVAGLLISGIVSGSSLMGLEMARLGVSESPAGQTTTIRYVLRNHGRVFPAMALNIEELDVQGITESTPSPVSPPAGSCELVAPRSNALAHASAGALRRGRGRLCRVRVWTTYPFGLTRKSVTFEHATEFLVLPRIPRVRADALRELVNADKRGVATASSRGISDEFWALREYREGDPTRNIAWKPSARTGQLIVRQTAALTPVRLWIEIGPHDDERFEQAIRLAAGLIASGSKLGWAIGLSLPNAGICIAPHDSQRQLPLLLRALAVATQDNTRPAAPGPKLGEAVLRIGADNATSTRHRRVIGIEAAGSLLEPGESLIDAASAAPSPSAGLVNFGRRLLGVQETPA